MSQNQGDDNSATRDRVDSDRREGSNILKKEEVTWEHPVTTIKYMSMDKLYSASMADVKTKLDKTMDLFKFDYCKIGDLSPVLYANKSSVFYQLKWEEKSPGQFVGNVPMFSLHLDCNLPEKPEHLENVPPNVKNINFSIKRVLQSLINEQSGINTAAYDLTCLLRNLTPSHGLVNTVDIALLHMILGELLRKQSRFNLSNNHLICGTDLLRSSKESTPIVDYLKPLTGNNKLEVISFVFHNVSVYYVLIGQLDNVNECLDMKIKCFGMQTTDCVYSLIQKWVIYGLRDKFDNSKTFITTRNFSVKAETT